MAGTFFISTGLRDYMLATGSLKGGIDGGVIRIYADDAAIPANADAAVGSATLLCIISDAGGGTGITFEATPVAGVLSKSTSEEWYGTILANGTASFFRFSAITDAGASSTTEKRMQGTVGLVNADFLVRDVNFVLGEEQRADSCNLGMPESQ